MDFIIKLGETGHEFSYQNIQTTEKVSFLQELIKKDTKIDQKDQILFTKKGYKLQPDEILSVLEKENNFMSTMTNVQNVAKPTFPIFVFDARRYNGDQKYSPKDYSSYFSENNDDIRNYLIEEKIIEKDYYTSLQSEIDNNSADEIKKINPNILNIEAKLFGHFLNLKKSFLQIKSRLRKVGRFVKESENQQQSVDTLVKFASLFYNPCKLKKSELTKKFNVQEEKNNLTLKKFDDSIEKLKKIELHEALKTDKHKVLLDIYYNQESMCKWKNTCIEFQKNVKGKIEKQVAIIKTIKDKIKDERDQCTNSIQPALQAQKQTFENCLKDIEPLILKIFEEHYKAYKSIRSALENYLGSKTSENEEILRDDSWGRLVERDLDEDRKIYAENLERVEKVIDQVFKMKGSFENQVAQCFKAMNKYKAELTILQSEKLTKLIEDIDKLDRDFNYLLNPSHLPSAYQASLVEVSRKREFLLNFDKAVKKVQIMCDIEKENRKKFL